MKGQYISMIAGDTGSQKLMNDQGFVLISDVQELLDHKKVRTTMVYTHVLNRGIRGVKSPIDFS